MAQHKLKVITRKIAGRNLQTKSNTYNSNQLENSMLFPINIEYTDCQYDLDDSLPESDSREKIGYTKKSRNTVSNAHSNILRTPSFTKLQEEYFYYCNFFRQNRPPELKEGIKRSLIRLNAARQGSDINVKKHANYVSHESRNISSSVLNNNLSDSKKREFIKTIGKKYEYHKPTWKREQKINKSLIIEDKHSKIKGSYLNMKNNDEDSKVQLSFVDNKQITPYIKLKGINELNERYTNKWAFDSPFLGMIKKEKNGIVGFFDFAMKKWIRTSLSLDKRSTKLRKSQKIKQKIQEFPKLKMSSNSITTSKKLKPLKIEPFDKYVKLFQNQAKRRIFRKKYLVNTEKLRKKGCIPILDEFFNSSVKAMNPVSKAREICKNFYLAKQKKRENCKKQLEALDRDRSFAQKIKSQFLDDSSFESPTNIPSDLRILLNLME